MPRHLMLVPSLACPAGCKYCFGPHEGGPPMPCETVEAGVWWQESLDGGEPLEITFHGGEPLVPGAEFYRMALPLLREGLAPCQVSFGMQSNLWLLTDELCELFREYDVSLGTSLDGPEPINDAQRGKGYFRRTMAGMERAHAHGLSVGCICTFTAQSAPRAREVFDFFARERLGFSIHAALLPLGHSDNGWTLSPEAHGQLLVDMLERYLANLDKVRISTLDAMCRSVSAGRGGICTFGDCLGEYLAVDPEGWIYACQRFAGMPAYRLGNVHDCPSPEMLAATPAWRAFQDRQERIKEECGDCPHPVVAAASTGRRPNPPPRGEGVFPLPLGGGQGEGDYATVFFPFPFEALPEEARPAVMERIVGWLSWLGSSTFSVDREAVAAGGILAYTLSLRNDGPETVTASLSNTLPVNLAIVTGSVTGPGNYYTPTRHLSWSGPLDSGELITFTYRATVVTGTAPGSPIVNTASLGIEDHHVRFHRAAVVRVGAPDFSPSSFGCDPYLARPGAIVTCTLALANVGPGDALTVTAAIFLPVDATFVPGSLDWAGGGATEVFSDTVRWSGALGAGNEITLTYQLNLSGDPVHPPLYSVAFLEDGVGGAWERATWLFLEPWRAYLPVVMRNGP